jgi:hypothetical protein
MFCRALVVLAPVVLAGGCQQRMEDFTSNEFKFKARFPGTPKREDKVARVNTTRTTFIVTGRDGVCAVSVADMPIIEGLPEGWVAAALALSEADAIKSGEGVLKSSSSITLNGKYAGREYTASVTKPRIGQLRVKMYVVGTRIYQVEVRGIDKYATSPQVEEFLNSFEVIE